MKIDLVNDAISNPSQFDNQQERYRAEALFAQNETKADAATMLLYHRKFLSAKQMNCLGECYFEGYGVSVDYNEAVSLFKKASELGDSNAMYNMGMSHLKGLGSWQDYYSAYEWFRKSADLGNGYAMIRIGDMYRRDQRSVFQIDTDTVIKWYQMAIDHGASCTPGIGFGPEPNFMYDKIWYLKMAEEGKSDAMFKIGYNYVNGFGGVKKDEELAQYWLKKAANLGNAKAMDLLKKL